MCCDAIQLLRLHPAHLTGCSLHAVQLLRLAPGADVDRNPRPYAVQPATPAPGSPDRLQLVCRPATASCPSYSKSPWHSHPSMQIRAYLMGQSLDAVQPQRLAPGAGVDGT